MADLLSGALAPQSATTSSSATRGRSVRRLALLQKAITAIHEQRRPSDALSAAVRVIATANNWRVGHVYLRRGTTNSAVSTSILHVDGSDPDSALRKALRETQHGVGANLASHVLMTGKPLWVDDLSPHPGLARLASLGLRMLVMLPVATTTRTVAVLEFMSEQSSKPTEGFLGVMDSVGIQLGYLIERANLQRRVARLAVREERRIAVELHDTVGQEATAAGILARMLLQDLEKREAPEVEMARRLADTVQDLKVRVRDFIATVHSVDVEPRDLTRELEHMAERYALLGQCTCSVEVDPSVTIADTLVATTIFRIASEAVNNAVRHGKPSHVRIALHARSDDSVVLEVQDDGAGTDRESLSAGGLGQQGMRYRAGLLAADLDVVAEPQKGVLVRCVIPFGSLRDEEREEDVR